MADKAAVTINPENQALWLKNKITLREFAKRENKYLYKISLSTAHLSRDQKAVHRPKLQGSSTMEGLISDKQAARLQRFMVAMLKENGE